MKKTIADDTQACVGLWFGCSASMRSQYLPQGALASIMGIFRVPLNALVVTGQWVEHVPFAPSLFCVLSPISYYTVHTGTKMTDMFSPVSVYTTIAVWLAVAMVLQVLRKRALLRTTHNLACSLLCSSASFLVDLAIKAQSRKGQKTVLIETLARNSGLATLGKCTIMGDRAFAYRRRDVGTAWQSSFLYSCPVLLHMCAWEL